MFRVQRTSVEHLPAIHAMLQEEIDGYFAHFGTTVPSLEELTAEFNETASTHPWLTTTELDGTVVGFARATPWRTREAYRWTAEVTAYVRRDMLAEGIGTALMERLVGVLKRQGFAVLIACIAVPNDAALALFDKLDFVKVGELPEVGYKNGAWRSVAYYQRRLIDSGNSPVPDLAGIDESLP